MHPIRQAVHQLRAHPGFNTLIILLLAVGIGANTTMFSFVRGVLLKPLPYPESGELVLVRKQTTPESARRPGGADFVADKEFLAWSEADLPAFRDLAGYRNERSTWRRRESSEFVSNTLVTADFFKLLGVSAHRGRLIERADTQPGATRVAVLDYDFWRNNFGGEADIIGTSLQLGDEVITVVGVLPPTFEFIGDAQLWTPLILQPVVDSSPGAPVFVTPVTTLARIAPGVSLDAAAAQLEQVSDRFWNAGVGGLPPFMIADLRGGPAQLLPLQEYLAGDLRQTLWFLFGAVGLVLLIGCVNLANLQLARATSRRHELAVRTALGASRRQLALGLLTENLLPALIGGTLGVLLSFWGIELTSILLADQLPRVMEISVDWWVAGFTLLLACGTGLAFGMVPAWQIRKLDPQDALHTGGRVSMGSPSRTRWRQACIAIEVALALALAANAGLLLRSFFNLRAVDLGIRTEDVMTLQLPAGENFDPFMRRDADEIAQTNSRLRDLGQRYRQALAQVPGVSQVSIGNYDPLTDFNMMLMARVEGYAVDPASPPPAVVAIAADGDYFDTVGTPLMEGRAFSTSDGDGAPLVAIVNKAFVDYYFPGESVIGRRIQSFANPEEMATIVGVAVNTRRSALDQSPQVKVYVPRDQWPQSHMVALLRIENDSATVAAAVLAALRQFDSTQAYGTPITLAERQGRTLAPRKLLMGLLIGFAGTAIGLAAIGIFGVMAYAVAQRTHEFGVRMALGADRQRILIHVLRGAGLAVIIGLVSGIGFGLAGSRLIASTLFSVAPYDPIVLLGAATILAVTAMIAALMPALRAARLNPVEALRAE